MRFVPLIFLLLMLTLSSLTVAFHPASLSLSLVRPFSFSYTAALSTSALGLSNLVSTSALPRGGAAQDDRATRTARTPIHPLLVRPSNARTQQLSRLLSTSTSIMPEEAIKVSSRCCKYITYCALYNALCYKGERAKWSNNNAGLQVQACS